MKRVALACACLLLVLAHGCGAERRPPEELEAAPQPRADATARAWLLELRRVHALADSASSPAAQLEAADALAALARAAHPASVRSAEANQLRQDLYGRAADLLTQLGEPGRALALLDDGLALGADPNHFFTQLVLQTVEVKAALGDAEGAERARKWAERLLQ